MAEPALNLWPCEIEALRPPESTTVSAWANEHIILLPESSPRAPGPYRWQRTPYARAVMDLYAHPDIRHIVLKWATQTSKTQSVYNILGYIVDQEPYSTMLLYPSEDESKSISRARVQPMFEACAATAAKIPADRGRYQLLEMNFPGMVLYISSGSGVASMAQRPVRNLIRDEVNKYPPLIAEHGDPMALSEQRTKGSWSIRKIIDVSSPTTESGNITRQEQECQVILRYYVPCPHCHRLQWLEWPQIRFENRSDLDKVSRIALAKRTAVYVCRYCAGEIRDAAKAGMLAPESGAGWYAHTAEDPLPSADPIADLFERFELQGARLESIAFRLSSLYSPWIAWGDVVEAFLKAHLAEIDRFRELQSFTNDWLGEEWVDAIEEKSEHDILKLRCELPPLVVPPQAIALTCGVDCQKRGFYYTVWAWARDLTCWMIQYGYLLEWDHITRLIHESAYQTAGSGRRLGLWRAALDTGGGELGEDGSMTDAAYTWLARWGGNVALGVKGASRETAERVKPTIIGTFPGTKRPIPGAGVKLLVVDTSYFKDVFSARMQVKAGDPGAVYLHAETGADFAEQLAAEEKRRDKRGIYRWVAVRGKNHYWDASIYASVLVSPLCLGGLSLVPDAAPERPAMHVVNGMNNGMKGTHTPQSGRGDRW